MLGFFLVAVLFVGLVTAVVRLAGLGVRRDLPERNELALTGLFVALVLLAWWFLTRGEHFEDRLVNVTILPSPLEMLKAFVPLHLDQALVRNALTSIERNNHAYGLNKVGLERRGFTPAQLKALRHAYRLLQHSKLNTSDALAAIRSTLLESESPEPKSLEPDIRPSQCLDFAFVALKQRVKIVVRGRGCLHVLFDRPT